MDYEEKYKDLVKRLNKAREEKGVYTFNSVLDVVAPELKIDESEDERIRKEIIDFLGLPHPQFVGKRDHEKWIAWLEKQGEQKSTLRIDNSRAKVVFPFKAKLKSTGIVVTIYNGQLSRDGKEWIKYQSDKEDGCNVYEPEDLEPVCNVEPKQEWNEEDEDILNTIINHFKVDIECTDEDDVVRWLKSLRPQWKPNEEMLEALYRAIPKNVMEISEDEMLLDKLYQGLKYGRVLSEK